MAKRVIDPSVGPRMALEGRVVTMNEERKVLDRAVIYIANGHIEAIKSHRARAPAGFADVEIIRTGDTIYPGLIELHNHLSYNVLPLWNVPRRFDHNGQWKNHIEKRRLVSSPMKVLAKTPGLIEAVVRYVECKTMFGGATTSQGITLSSAAGIRKHYRGIVRNVEQTEEEEILPEAVTRIADVSNAESFFRRLQNQSCLLLHLSEGIGSTARSRFEALMLNEDDWAITHALCGIHSAGLEATDFDILAHHGGSMVWSPLSNLLLYGDTAKIAAAKDAGVLIGIGADWSPSGSKNLLGELKVAHLMSEFLGGLFTPVELLAMATCDAARILKWESALGSVEVGKKADLLLLEGRSGDPYEKLLRAYETTISLVVINGTARYGQTRLMQRLGPISEELRVGRAKRALNLRQDTADPVVGELTLAEATARLESGMAALPVLAREIEAQEATDSGFFSGTVDSNGETWQLELDNEFDETGVARLDPLLADADVDSELSLLDVAGARMSLSELVEPMRLDPLTVRDDPEFLPRLLLQRNLPDHIKRGLPPLYGSELALPDAARFLESAADALRDEMLLIMTLRGFLSSAGSLSIEERRTIVEQSLLVIEQNYVHLTLKQSMYGINPEQRLRLLMHRLDAVDSVDSLEPELEFHREVMAVFTSLRDLHTAYEPPEPFSSVVAFLPFTIEECFDGPHPRFIVTGLVGDPGPEAFERGVEILYWNGIPIEQAVLRHTDVQAGGNSAARRARAIDTLTIRPLRRMPAPDEEWVSMQFRGRDGEIHEWRQDWLVFMPRTAMDPNQPADDDAIHASAALGIDVQTDATQETRKRFFAQHLMDAERSRSSSRTLVITGGEYLDTSLPTTLRARAVETPHGRFGHLRIFSFKVHDADGFVAEVARLLGRLPQDGLIIDVRGNGGGLIHAAEQLLQLFTPKQIEPETAQFGYSSLNLALCEHFSGSNPPLGLNLTPWLESMSLAVRTGATYSLSHPISDPQSCNELGQHYFGPIVLITDALCYSATDMFIAGFQDHQIGQVVGVHDNTGAGGANVWSHRLLSRLMAELDDDVAQRFVPLPHGANLSVAIRRTLRVGQQAGSILEDFGVPTKREDRYRITANDLLNANADLMAHAGALLDAQRKRRHLLDARVHDLPRRQKEIKYRAKNIDRLDVFIDGRPLESRDIDRVRGSITLKAASVQAGLRLELAGYLKGELVAKRLIAL